VREVLVWTLGALEALFLEAFIVLFLGLEEERLGKGIEGEKVGFVPLGEFGGLKVLSACLGKGEKQKGDQHQ
jgi:hypothetical protein